MGHLVSGGYLGVGVRSTRGPYWQPALSARRFSSALGSLGDAAALVLPTQVMAGASGYIVATVTTPPVAQLQWNSSQAPNVQIWVQDTTGAIQLYSSGSAAGTGSINWLTAGSTGVTFFVIPVDASGNTYAPVDQVMVPGTPGIYPSPNTPSSVVQQLSANNLGLQVYGLEAPPPVATTTTSSDPFAFLASLPGGETPWLIGGALVLFMALGSHK
jgi:hypothetical protein